MSDDPDTTGDEQPKSLLSGPVEPVEELSPEELRREKLRIHLKRAWAAIDALSDMAGDGDEMAAHHLETIAYLSSREVDALIRDGVTGKFFSHSASVPVMARVSASKTHWLVIPKEVDAAWKNIGAGGGLNIRPSGSNTKVRRIAEAMINLVEIAKADTRWEMGEYAPELRVRLQKLGDLSAETKDAYWELGIHYYKQEHGIDLSSNEDLIAHIPSPERGFDSERARDIKGRLRQAFDGLVK